MSVILLVLFLHNDLHSQQKRFILDLHVVEKYIDSQIFLIQIIFSLN
jgi:hypothetical protein